MCLKKKIYNFISLLLAFSQNHKDDISEGNNMRGESGGTRISQILKIFSKQSHRKHHFMHIHHRPKS